MHRLANERSSSGGIASSSTLGLIFGPSNRMLVTDQLGGPGRQLQILDLLLGDGHSLEEQVVVIVETVEKVITPQPPEPVFDAVRRS